MSPPRLFLRCCTALIMFPLLFVLPRTAAAEPEFTVHTIDGADATGTLVRLDADWSLELSGRLAAQVPGSQLVSVRHAGSPLPLRPSGEQIVFANGDCLPSHVLGLRGERLRVRVFNKTGPEMTVPLSTVTVLWLAAPDTISAPRLFLRRLVHEQRRRDVIYLRNGDTLDGILTGFDPGAGVRLQVNRRPTTVPVEKVSAVALNTHLARLRMPPGSYGHLVLANGARLGVSSAQVAAGRMHATTLFGARLNVPLADVAALDVYAGPAIYLSTLRPRSYQFRSYLGADHASYVPDGTVLPGAPFGGDMVMEKNAYDRGIGMTGSSRLSYALDGRYRWFEATVGLDDTAKDGQGRIAVQIDGKPIHLSWNGKLTGGHAPHTVRVDVAQARELTLIVDFGEAGSVRERVLWADARLVRGK